MRDRVGSQHRLDGGPLDRRQGGVRGDAGSCTPGCWVGLPLVDGVALVENFHEETAPSRRFQRARSPTVSQRCWNGLRRDGDAPGRRHDLLVVDELGRTSPAREWTRTSRPLPRPQRAGPRRAVDQAAVRPRAHRGDEGQRQRHRAGRHHPTGCPRPLDRQKTYANALTSASTAMAKLPLVAPDDEFAIRTALSALGGYDPDTVRIVWMQTIQDLSTLHVEPLVDELPPLPKSPIPIAPLLPVNLTSLTVSVFVSPFFVMKSVSILYIRLL